MTDAPVPTRAQPKQWHRPLLRALRVRNYRSLGDFEVHDLGPLSVFLGANGAGKSTLLDVLSFVRSSLASGIEDALADRGELYGIATSGRDSEPTCVEMTIQPARSETSLVYAFEIVDLLGVGGVEVLSEVLYSLSADGLERVDYLAGPGPIRVRNELNGTTDIHQGTRPELLSLSRFAGMAEHPTLTSVFEFIRSWRVFDLQASATRGVQPAVPIADLSRHGDNLVNVLLYLQENEPQRLDEIQDELHAFVPAIDRIVATRAEDGRVVLRFAQTALPGPLLARYESDGTLRTLELLTLRHHPGRAGLVGIEEPEAGLYPTVLTRLAETCRAASDNTQLFVTTHSPQFVDALYPDEVWMMYRDQVGMSRAIRAADREKLMISYEYGGHLGDLWMEGAFQFDEPRVLDPR